jgi:uncharacterized membrane protein YdjX (TVP38/TMEM64 family)
MIEPAAPSPPATWRRVLPRVAVGLAIVVALVVAWQRTPIAELTHLEALVAWAERLRAQPAAVLLAPLAFVGVALLFVPVVLLRAAAVLVFGPFFGPFVAVTGSMLGAVIGHEVGRRIGGPALDRLAGERMVRLRARLARTGPLAVAAVRVVPLGPFNLVNLAFGATGVSRRDFLLGTLLAMTPGVIVMALAVSLLPSLRELVFPG